MVELNDDCFNQDSSIDFLNFGYFYSDFLDALKLYIKILSTLMLMLMLLAVLVLWRKIILIIMINFKLFTFLLHYYFILFKFDGPNNINLGTRRSSEF